MNWKADWNLRARMAGVTVLLAALYISFIAVITAFTSSLTFVAVLIGLVAFAQFWWGDAIALKASKARRVDEDEYPELHEAVTRLSQQADLPKPDVAVSKAKAPNAFAAGRSQSSAVVCVTEGLLDQLDEEELDAVLAHELAHVKNRDVVIMTIASVFAAIFGYIVRWGWLYDDGGGGNQHVIIAVLASVVAWVVSFFVLRLLSRYREYAADRGAAVITGQPSALASALKKIDGQSENMPEEDLRDAKGVDGLMFFSYDVDFMSRWFSTHPAVEKRVERLQEIQKNMDS